MSENYQHMNQLSKQPKDRSPDLQQLELQQPELQQPDLQEPEELLIDVSGLDHPQPFEEVMSCLKNLREGSYLHMLHRRTPYPLLQILNENGFDFIITDTEKKAFEALIWKTEDLTTGNYCKKQ